MTKEENELLTRVGPGTPAGALMRRYWQPAALSEELPPGGPPKPIRLLGEELVLFRDDRGRPGLLGLHCSHRGADLSYGRLEDGGLRCIYHGWLYDIHGRCLDQPGEPGGGDHKSSIRHPAYPCEERAGVIFAYMGDGEPPLLPDYEFLTVPEEHRFVIKLFHECNYLQGNEGNIDLIHASFLHYHRFRDEVGETVDASGKLGSRGLAATLESVEAELRDFGVWICRIRKKGTHKFLFLGTFLLPNAFAFYGVPNNEGYSVNWHVPIDDTHHWKYTFTFNRVRSLDKETVRRARADMTPDYRSLRNRANRYLQDRDSMKGESYSGIGFNFQVQDLYATEGQGPTQDRGLEHLVASDRTVVACRKILLKAIHDVSQGLEAPYIVRDNALNRFPQIFAYRTVAPVPAQLDWKAYFKNLEGEVAR